MVEMIALEHVATSLLEARAHASTPSLQFAPESINENIDISKPKKYLSAASVRFVRFGYRAPKIAEDPED